MQLYTPKKTPPNWYRYDVQFSTELLREYIRGVETQIATTAENFHREKETRLSDDAPEEGTPSLIEVYRGLDSEAWDLNAIFEYFFPNLQRRSALITLFSFFEHELDGLCDLFIRKENVSVSLNDMRGTGIDRSVLFLTKVVGLPIDKDTALWQEIKNVQKIRNLIVHNNGELKDRSGNAVGDVIKYIIASPYLSGEDEVEIRDGYLAKVIDTFAGIVVKDGRVEKMSLVLPIVQFLRGLPTENARDRADIVGIFANEVSIIRLIGAVLLLQQPLLDQRGSKQNRVVDYRTKLRLMIACATFLPDVRILGLEPETL